MLFLLQHRVFLTCDNKLAARRDVGGAVLLLHSDDPQQQMEQVRTHFGLR